MNTFFYGFHFLLSPPLEIAVFVDNDALLVDDSVLVDDALLADDATEYGMEITLFESLIPA